MSCVSLATPGTKACDAVGGAFRPEWREGARAPETGQGSPQTLGGLCYHSHMRANIITRNQASVSLSEDLCDVPCLKEALVKRLRSKMPSEEAIEETRVLFGALADWRAKILYSLKYAEELCVCDVAHVLGTSVSTASHHLRKLRDLKIVKYRNDGKMAYYSLKNDFAVQLVADVLDSAKR